MQSTSTQHLRLAAAHLRAGSVIAHATEGVWGLACDPFDAAAVRRVLALKSRPREKGMILICADLGQVMPLFEPLSADEREQVSKPADHPVTWLVPCKAEVPALLRGSHTTLAIRITRHEQARALIERCGLPLLSTSANPAGRPPALTALRVRQYCRDNIDYLLPGDLGGARGPSEIRRLQDRVVAKVAKVARVARVARPGS